MKREHKWGDIREPDGKMFWCYHKRKKSDGTPYEYQDWITPEMFKKRSKIIKENLKKLQKTESFKAKRRAKDKLFYSDPKNREHKRQQEIKYRKKRRAQDPDFLIKCKIRTRICMALKNKKVKKSLKTVDLIGCSYEFLRMHIERQFKHGMCWNKKHSFHIDHIRPLSSFDLTDPEQLKNACHWTNLQPLYPEENMRKGSKIIEDSFGLCKNESNDATAVQ